MKLRLLLLLGFLLPLVVRAADDPPAAWHPLRGVVVEVIADRQSLLVKHEEVPGVMRAMTMLFRVAPAVLAEVKKGDAITAQMGRDAEGKWALREVKVVPPLVAK